MSKANKQSLCFISAIAGCVSTILSKNHYARVDIKRQLADTFQVTLEVLKRWPEDEREECVSCVRYIKIWAEEMGARQDRLSGATLLYIVSRILDDLESKLKNKEKLRMIGGIRKAIQPVFDFVDPDKENWIAFEEGDAVLNILYDLTEWRY